MAHRVLLVSNSRVGSRLLEKVSRGDLPSITTLRKAARALVEHLPKSETRLFERRLITQSIKRWRTLLNSGFGKFFRNAKKGPTPVSKDTRKPDKESLIKAIIAAAAGSFAIVAYLLFTANYKEITYKDFVNNYLSSGGVERLEVVNKKWVKVRLTNQAEIPWFYIGSVDAFERNLETVQAENGLDSKDFIPVIYNTELDSSSWVDILLTAAIMGFLWFARTVLLSRQGLFKIGQFSSWVLLSFCQSTASSGLTLFERLYTMKLVSCK